MSNAKRINSDDVFAKHIGQAIAQELKIHASFVAGLGTNRETGLPYEPRFYLANGDKTAAGLARTVLRIIEEGGAL